MLAGFVPLLSAPVDAQYVAVDADKVNHYGKILCLFPFFSLSLDTCCSIGWVSVSPGYLSGTVGGSLTLNIHVNLIDTHIE